LCLFKEGKYVAVPFSVTEICCCTNCAYNYAVPDIIHLRRQKEIQRDPIVFNTGHYKAFTTLFVARLYVRMRRKYSKASERKVIAWY
jgi:hypothetical protein